jgi:hypothetical protein
MELGLRIHPTHKLAVGGARWHRLSNSWVSIRYLDRKKSFSICFPIVKLHISNEMYICIPLFRLP